jgi:hypothetical protein
MTALEFTKLVAQKNRTELPDEAAAKEVAALVSGSTVYPLYELLDNMDFDMQAVTEQLEMLFDSENYFGLVYLIFILSEAANLDLAEQFYRMAADNGLIPILSAAFIEDWLDFHQDYED